MIRKSNKTTTLFNGAFYLLMAILLIAVCPLPSLAWAPVGVSGSWVRTVQDNEGNIHMVYAEPWGGVQYVKFNGSSWIGPSYLPNSAQQWFNFTNPDVAVGPDGRAQVVYGIKNGEWPDDFNYFVYAKANDANGTSWNHQIMFDDGGRRNYTRIAVDENNQPHIVYMKTNTVVPYWWNVIYLRPDGIEKIIDVGWDANRVNNPTIAYKDGVVHIAYYRGGSGSMTTNIMYARDNPYGEFPLEQLTNMPYNWFVDSPDIAVAPDGHAEIVFFKADWTGSPGYYQGVWAARLILAAELI